MDNFVFQCPTKIIFGKNTENEVGRETKRFSSKILLHYGGGSIKKSGLYEKVVNSLNEAGVEFIELPGAQPNPRLSLVKKGIDICRKNNINFILAVGGGSAIDSAKAMAVGVPYDGDVWDFYKDKQKPVTEALPIGVVLTLPATGSEASSSSVITNEEGNFKKGIGSDFIRPRFAIMDPCLTFPLPPSQTANGAADIMAHVMERYFTNTTNVELTDRLCEATLRTVINNAPIALKEPDNYNARAEIMWAGTIAHNGLLGTGRAEDWASHKIEHELSGIYDVAHGAGLATIYPAWMKYVYKTNVDKFAQYAVRVWGIELDTENPENTALKGIEALKDFFRNINLPTSLKELNVPYDRFEEMAEKCTMQGPVGGLKKIYKQDVLNILNLAK